MTRATLRIVDPLGMTLGGKRLVFLRVEGSWACGAQRRGCRCRPSRFRRVAETPDQLFLPPFIRNVSRAQVREWFPLLEPGHVVHGPRSIYKVRGGPRRRSSYIILQETRGLQQT